MTSGDHAAGRSIEIVPIDGLPEFRPGDDIAGEIARAAPWLADGDVLIVTSKIFSKVENRLVPAPDDPEERDTLRRHLVEREAVRIVARRGRTLITENRLGIVQAASGIDGSNVDRSELALLPEDPDSSAAALRTALTVLLGVTVGVVVTDTMGRAWRIGQIDAAIGSAGIAVLHAYAGTEDSYGNELVVTEIAVADEIAAAGDLVKGKLGSVPVAVVRGLTIVDNGSRAADLIRGGEDDLFWQGTRESLEQGRREALLLRRSIRTFADRPVAEDDLRSAIAEALTAPAPHHTKPVRFVWVRTHALRATLLHKMHEQWRADLEGDGVSGESIDKRLSRGAILFDAPELVIPFLCPDGAHTYSDEYRQAAEQTMFTVAVGAAVQGFLVALAVRELGSCWVGSTIFTSELVTKELGLQSDWKAMGAIAVGYPAAPQPIRANLSPGSALIEI